MIYVGDIHGKFDRLREICAANPGQLHVGIGDVGIGFPGETPALPDNFNFFRGNHDNPEVCRNHPQYIHDYGMHAGAFIVAGADSVDKNRRTPGLTWWEDEQMSREAMESALEDYIKEKPDILVAHEAPFRLHRMQCEASAIHDPRNRAWGEPKGNSTAFLLDRMLDEHMPKVLIHGHWHNPLIYRQWGCIFVSLGELETLDMQAFKKFAGLPVTMFDVW